VQYFQRAVVEDHEEYAGTPNAVLLSLLGVFYFDRKHGDGGGGNTLPTPSPTPPTAPFQLAKPGWTHVVATTNNIVLFYNTLDGSGATAKLGADGALTPLQTLPSTGNGSFGPGWSNIVAGPNNVLLLYKYAGAATIVSMGDDGISRQVGTYTYQRGWERIAIDTETALGIFYNDTTGAEAVAQLQPSGNFPTLKVYQLDTNTFRLSNFAPVGGSIWFIYASAKGEGVTSRLNADGTFTLLKSDTTFHRGWSHIVSDGSKTLFYDYEAGLAACGVIGTDGTFTQLKGFSNWSTDWSHVVAARNHIFLFYSYFTGRIVNGIFDNSGNYTDLATYEPSK
jgi:hypothetical protein